MREVKFGDDARNLMKSGIDTVANAVKLTLGPRGRNVALDNNPNQAPLITNDGATIARELTIDGEFENIGGKIIREAALKTDDAVGDGTSTATVLMQAIVTEAMKYLSTETDAMGLRAGIEAAARGVTDSIEHEATRETDQNSLIDIATISCGDEKIGKIVGTTIHRVGLSGLVTMEDSGDPETTAEVSEGLNLSGQLVSPFFLTNRALQEASLSNVPLLVTDQSVNNPYEIVRIMETCTSAGHKAAFLIANAVEGAALLTCIQNANQGNFTLIPVKVVAFGEHGENMMRDVCAATGATLISPKDGRAIMDGKGEAQITASDFGMADKIIATSKDVTIVGGQGATESRIEELEVQLTQKNTEFNKEAIRERIAKLMSGVGVIKVGGVTDSEREERKKRVEDAIHSTRAAFEDGVVSGGGSALLRASQLAVFGDTEDERLGYQAVLKACAVPFFQMASNSGIQVERKDIETIVENVDKAYNFKTDKLVTAHKSGIIDPVKVVTTALKNACSQAALFITTDAAVTSTTDKSEKI